MVASYREHPNTIWLWGNHEVSYILGRPVTGNIYAGKEYANIYRENFCPKFAHLDGKVIFSHAGIFQEFISKNNLESSETAGGLISKINHLSLSSFWRNNSPLWARPQYDRLTRPKILKDYLHVIGHTPMRDIIQKDGLVSVDVFSTNWGKKIGVERMITIDTKKPSFEAINVQIYHLKRFY